MITYWVGADEIAGLERHLWRTRSYPL